jgi:hypothetical protein
MIVQNVIAATLFLISMGCMARANLLFREIIAEINRVLPKDRTINPWGFNNYRFFEILAEYKRLCLGGKLTHKVSIWAGIGFTCFFASAGYWFLSGAGTAGYISRHH